MPRCLSNFRAIRPLQHPISRLRDFTRFGGKTSYRLVNRGPGEQLSRHMYMYINTLRPRQIGRHFADDIFKYIFFNENVWIPIKISLKFVPKGRINNIPALVQIMAWRRPGDKPLSGPIIVSLLTHICDTRPQWVKICVGIMFLHMTLCNKFSHTPHSKCMDNILALKAYCSDCIIMQII